MSINSIVEFYEGEVPDSTIQKNLEELKSYDPMIKKVSDILGAPNNTVNKLANATRG